MKRCLSCNHHYASTNIVCPSCDSGPQQIDGFYAYAPDFAHSGGGFKSSYFSELAQLEETNFWFRSRNQLLLWAIEKYCSGFKSFLEIGCGNGYVLSSIVKAYPHAGFHGSEIFTTGLGFASERLPSVNLMQMDARNIPYYEEFDVIGAFDVLEHIKEDSQVLQQIHASLRPQGVMLITVPQHEWLWSITDEYACHVRRYTAAELHHKVEKAGFQILKTTSFVTTLLPAMLASRLFQSKQITDDFDATAELKIHPRLNALFYQLLGIDLACIKNGWNLPTGGSRLVVAKKDHTLQGTNI